MFSEAFLTPRNKIFILPLDQDYFKYRTPKRYFKNENYIYKKNQNYYKKPTNTSKQNSNESNANETSTDIYSCSSSDDSNKINVNQIINDPTNKIEQIRNQIILNYLEKIYKM